MIHSLDIIIIVIFLASTLVVGLGHGRRIKTIKDYALGGRNFSTGALVATIVATWVSGSGFFIVLSHTYSDGLYYIIAECCMGIQLLIMAFFLVPRMKEFLGSTSIAEAIGNLYGDRVRIIIAITGIMGAVGFIAVQFKAFGTIVSYFSGFSGSVTIILAGTVVTLYSAFGGIRAVTLTDVLQFVTFGVALPFVGMMIWNQVYFEEFFFFSSLEAPQFDYRKVFDIGNSRFWQMIPLIMYFIFPPMNPTLCQRILIGRNTDQVKKAFIIAAMLVILIKLTIGWIPFLLFSVNPDLEPNNLLGYIIDNYTIVGIKGLIIIGIMAMAMSTADCVSRVQRMFTRSLKCRENLYVTI